MEQSGAVEACWAHNPEVRRSKLRSAKAFFVKSHYWSSIPSVSSSLCIPITKCDDKHKKLAPWIQPIDVFENWKKLHTSTWIGNEFASDTFLKVQTQNTYSCKTSFGVVLQWRNRLARRTYKQYLWSFLSHAEVVSSSLTWSMCFHDYNK